MNVPEPVAGLVSYRPEFLDRTAASALQTRLTAAAPWQQESLKLYGREVTVPRLVAWFGDSGVNYRYSGADHRCDGWLPELEPVVLRLAAEHGLVSNLVLVNRYRSGVDHMGWHTDAERGLGRRIASLSLGATRRFLVRPPGGARSCSLDLEHGSLLLMDGRLRHALPKTRRAVAERLNLTFRWVEPGA